MELSSNTFFFSLSQAYAPKNGHIHYSGPLRGENLDEMLKEHERQIQQVFRKARLDKVKINKSDNENGQTESLLHHVRSHKWDFERMVMLL